MPFRDVELLAAVKAVLSQYAHEACCTLPSTDPLCSELERWIPRALTPHYPEWRWDSLDGFLDVRCSIASAVQLDIFAFAIVISDQLLTPCCLQFRFEDATMCLATCKIQLGIFGGTGRLGIGVPRAKATKSKFALEKMYDAGELEFRYVAELAIGTPAGEPARQP
jgi:hypothetical protein